MNDSSKQLKLGQIILLVENDDDLANAMSLMIEDWGAHVIHALSGEEAMAILKDIDLVPDVLLLDCQLGEGMPGTDLHVQITQLYGPIPTRMISANRDKALLHRCDQLGLTLMSKPIDREKLFDFLVSTS